VLLSQSTSAVGHRARLLRHRRSRRAGVLLDLLEASAIDHVRYACRGGGYRCTSISIRQQVCWCCCRIDQLIVIRFALALFHSPHRLYILNNNNNCTYRCVSCETALANQDGNRTTIWKIADKCQNCDAAKNVKVAPPPVDITKPYPFKKWNSTTGVVSNFRLDGINGGYKGLHFCAVFDILSLSSILMHNCDQQ
jgi:hypothetical protein